MAKREKLHKGFGFYLLMFILILVAAFMIIVTIMMFTPKKPILGYQYFTYSDEYVINKDTDTKEELNFATTARINVNTTSASVSIIKTDEVKEDSVQIVNKSMGFAKKGQNVDFKYSVKYTTSPETGKTLNIVVNEAQGFLYFTNNVQVVIKLPIDSKYKFENTEFVITTTSGAVNIGSKTTVKDPSKDVNLNINNLTASTKKGSISITKYNNEEFSNLSLNTGSGSFSTELERVNVNNAKIVTNSGKFNFKHIISKNPLDLNLGDGTFIAENVAASVSLVAHNAKINIAQVAGDFTANETADRINKAIVTVDIVTGDVSFPTAKASQLTFKKVLGNININTTSGSVNLGQTEAVKGSVLVQTEKGSITAKVGYKEDASHVFITKTGKVNLDFETDVGKNTVTSESGEVTLNFKSNSKFILDLKNALGEGYKELTSKINIPFLAGNQYTYPLVVNGYQGDNAIIDISTNGRINAYLKDLTTGAET